MINMYQIYSKKKKTKQWTKIFRPYVSKYATTRDMKYLNKELYDFKVKKI
ncbi:MAG TPA: hypothetical protein VMZ91_16065 [Candidatus Paceibacterota bacterium]|nr:hypothetical protein [Candidatus Paceibacterota bacterium]